MDLPGGRRGRQRGGGGREGECDVYVGHGGDARRMAAWLHAVLELLGVPCVAADRRRCGDAPAHAAERGAMDAAVVGVTLSGASKWLVGLPCST